MAEPITVWHNRGGDDGAGGYVKPVGFVQVGATGSTVAAGNDARLHTYTTGAATSVADGGTITHGLGATPTVVLTQASVSSEFVSVTALSGTTFTVAIKKDTGAAGTTQTVYWKAE